MSTEANKTLVLRLYKALNTGDFATLDEIMAPDYVDHTLPPGVPPTREGFKSVISGFREALPDLVQEIHDVIAEGDKVVVRSTIHGTQQGEFFGIPATGKRVAMAQIHIARVRDGQIAEHWANEDDLGLLQQLGAVPAPAGAPA